MWKYTQEMKPIDSTAHHKILKEGSLRPFVFVIFLSYSENAELSYTVLLSYNKAGQLSSANLQLWLR